MRNSLAFVCALTLATGLGASVAPAALQERRAMTIDDATSAVP